MMRPFLKGDRVLVISRHGGDPRRGVIVAIDGTGIVVQIGEGRKRFMSNGRTEDYLYRIEHEGEA